MRRVGGRRIMKSILIAGAILVGAALPAAAQQTDWSKVEIKTQDLGHGVYFLNWQGGDSLVLTGPDGTLLVDTSVPQMGGKITVAVAKLTDKPIRYVVNTHAHADHFGANEAMAKAGAVIIAHDNLRKRMAEGFAAFNQTIPPSPPAALPVITYADGAVLHLDGETVELIHIPNAHTDSDTIVRFKTAGVVHMSGGFGPGGTYPFYDIGSGGSLKGVIALQERVLSFTDDHARIIGDEGEPGSRRDLQAQHDMLVTLRGRVQKLIDQGKTEAEAVAAKPTADLDPIWVPKGGFLNGDVATRMAYQSLKGVQPQPQPPASRP